MPRTKPTKKGYRKVEVSVDTKRVEELLLLVKQTDSRTQILVAKVHNLQVEVQETLASNRALLAVLTALLDCPDGFNDVQAAMKNFLFKKNQPGAQQ